MPFFIAGHHRDLIIDPPLSQNHNHDRLSTPAPTPKIRYNAAVTEDGELFTWGLNDYGQLGLGDKEPRASPTRVQMPVDEAPIGTVSCGSTYAAAVTRAGKVRTTTSTIFWTTSHVVLSSMLPHTRPGRAEVCRK